MKLAIMLQVNHHTIFVGKSLGLLYLVGINFLRTEFMLLSATSIPFAIATVHHAYASIRFLGAPAIGIDKAKFKLG